MPMCSKTEKCDNWGELGQTYDLPCCSRVEYYFFREKCKRAFGTLWENDEAMTCDCFAKRTADYPGIFYKTRFIKKISCVYQNLIIFKIS